MNSSNTLNEKIESRDCKVGIFGLGYVGLPLSILFAESGFKVFGFDTDLKKINKLNSFKSYIFHIKDESIKKIIKMGFTPMRNFSFVNQLDVIIICVPTPVNKQNKPDLSHVKNTIKSEQSWEKNVYFNCNLVDGVSKVSSKAFENLLNQAHEKIYSSVKNIVR